MPEESVADIFDQKLMQFAWTTNPDVAADLLQHRDAIEQCIAFNRAVIPLNSHFTHRRGYSLSTQVNKKLQTRTPVMAISVPREELLEVFIDLIAKVHKCVTVLLESEHPPTQGQTFQSDEKDTTVVLSTFNEFQDVIRDDGNSIISVVFGKNEAQYEICLDPYKIIHLKGRNVRSFGSILDAHNVPRFKRTEMSFIYEQSDRLHLSSKDLLNQFELLCNHLNAERVT